MTIQELEKLLENKEIILNRVRREGRGSMKEFVDAFPELKLSDIHNIVQELKRDGRITFIGNKKHGHWELTSKTQI